MKQQIWVIKAGGELLESTSIRKKILSDLKKLSRNKSVILVHGGGPQIKKDLEKNKIPAKFFGGRRFTSPQGMTVVEKSLSGVINKSLSAELNKNGVRAVGISGRDGAMVTGKPMKKLGRAAQPVRVKSELLLALLQSGFVPVLSPVASDAKGDAVNINADDVASIIALAVKAQNLVFLTNVPGVLDQKNKRFPKLKPKQIQSLIKTQVIHGGMIPKVQSAIKALKRGVGEVDILLGKKGIKFSSGTRIIH